MLPAATRSPPKRLTPRRCALESRPLRVEPAPFFEANSWRSNRNIAGLLYQEPAARRKRAAEPRRCRPHLPPKGKSLSVHCLALARSARATASLLGNALHTCGQGCGKPWPPEPSGGSKKPTPYAKLTPQNGRKPAVHKGEKSRKYRSSAPVDKCIKSCIFPAGAPVH